MEPSQVANYIYLVGSVCFFVGTLINIFGQ